MSAGMTYDFSSPEEEAAFDRLMKRVLAEEQERFPAPGGRVWRALAVRLGSQAKAGLGAPCLAETAGGTGAPSNPHDVLSISARSPRNRRSEADMSGGKDTNESSG